MEPSRFPARPLSVYAVEQLPTDSGEIGHAIPVLVLEVPITGVADEVLGFVLSTVAGDWYSYVYDRARGEWQGVSDHDGAADGRPMSCYRTAARAIADYWRANATLDDGAWPRGDGEAVDVDGDASGLRAENS